jgi:uncharacterized membrane protein SpoIIM required for sporulation
MVLESIINPLKAKEHPKALILIGILFAIIAIIFSLWIFKTEASMVMILLVVLMSVPLMYSTNYIEEEEDIEHDEISALKEHSKSILFLTFLFLGFVIGFTLVYILAPQSLIQTLFSSQHEAISQVNSQISGNLIAITDFISTLLNNIKVLIFCIFFAFFFGAGAIFILAWNAAVISTAIGSFFREGIAQYANSIGLTNSYLYFHILTSGILRYMTHGIFEIIGYFVGGLAGGILSVAVIKHGIKSKEFSKVCLDVLILITISLGFLIIGAIVETLITPALF